MLSAIVLSIIAAALTIMGVVMSLWPPTEKSRSRWILSFGVLALMSVALAISQELARRQESRQMDASLLDVKTAVLSANSGLDKVKVGIQLIQQGLADVQRATQAPPIILAEVTTVQGIAPERTRPASTPTVVIVPPPTSLLPLMGGDIAAPAVPPNQPAPPTGAATESVPTVAKPIIAVESRPEPPRHDLQILEIIERYARGWSHLSLAEILDVYPSFPKQKETRNAFKDLTEYDMIVSGCVVEARITSTAVAECNLKVSYRHTVQGRRETSRQARFALTNTGRGWLIVGVSDVP